MISVLALGVLIALIDKSGRSLVVYALVLFFFAATYLIRWSFFKKSKDTSRE
jgi:hypothetical protein